MTSRNYSFVVHWAIIVALVLPICQAHAVNYAILIGVNQYDNPKESEYPLGDLKYAGADMELLRKTLIEARFITDERNVYLLTSETAKKPTRENILEAVDEVLKRITKKDNEDTVLFAFAGHGVQVDENGKVGDVLCCSDAKFNKDKDHEGIIFRSDLEKLFADRGPNNLRVLPKNKIFILDACRNNPAWEEKTDSGSRSIRSLGNQPETDAQMSYPGIIRLASCSPRQVSREGTNNIKNGIFTHFLVEGLRGEADKKVNGGNGNGEIALDELFFYARKKTSDLIVNQIPTKSEIEVDYPLSSVVMGKCNPEVSPERAPQSSQGSNTPSTQRSVSPQRPGGSGGGFSNRTTTR